MISVVLPDGASRSLPDGATGLDLAVSISPRLADRTLSALVNGEVRDLRRPLPDGAAVRLLTWEDAEGKATFWHSSAHLLAEALEALWPGTRFGIGPAIDGGFYYDVDFGDQVVSSDDFEKIEAKMAELAARKSVYERTEVPKAEALRYFTEKGDPYKLELIDGLADGSITFYKQGGFTDLCRGPHLPHTGFIKAVKVMSLAGAYWRGDEKNKQLTRIYGVTFPDAKLLKEHLERLEEAKKRDHRKIGREMELYTYDDDVGPGLPLWLPRGAAMIEKLETLAKETEFEAGYERVRTPHLAKESMYLKSGHLPYYAESMFPPMEMDGGRYYLKAMNCPHHHKIFASAKRSYRDLPLRLAEYGTCYRFEQSGELFGLMRVRSLQMNDAHIYCTEDQFEAEFQAVNRMYLRYFEIFGIDRYVMRFSRHEPSKLGQKYLDQPELWKKTEDMVRRVLVGNGIPFVEVADEAAFYGPKIDVQVYSAIGREFTLATNQVDFGVPARFGLVYTDDQGGSKTPLCIHRAPLGTHERFLGFLIEHFAGRFPLWLSPEPVRILSLGAASNDYARSIRASLRSFGLAATVDERGESLGKKVREAQMDRVPLAVTVGGREAEARQVSVRNLDGAVTNGVALDDFLATLKRHAEERLVAPAY